MSFYQWYRAWVLEQDLRREMKTRSLEPVEVNVCPMPGPLGPGFYVGGTVLDVRPLEKITITIKQAGEEEDDSAA
jgi:uncharacterized protein YndB with AHSA1/START domain